MKKIGLVGIVIFISLLLSACANKYQDSYQTQIHHNLLNECWMGQVNTNPRLWTHNADYWFATGDPNPIEEYSRVAPISDSITTMNVRSPNFTNIEYSGSYQVQIVGYQGHNGVSIIGPNDQVRKIIVKTTGHTLYLGQANDCVGPLNKVIVRIGTRNLHNLMIHGTGMILGRNINSDSLSIYSTSRNKIFLEGNMNVRDITQYGSGIITVIGANTPSLKMKVIGPGCVNVSGEVGVEQIIHSGSGAVSIIGANTDRLYINASGSGITTVYGFANLKRVNAFDNSQVYAYWINSNSTYIFERGRSHVGLAGTAKNLNVDIIEGSRFDGNYLNSENVYSRTRDSSHANIRSSQRLFAAALDNSSIYFMGSPTVVSRYTSRNGIVLPIWTDSCPIPNVPTFIAPKNNLMNGQTKVVTPRRAYK